MVFYAHLLQQELNSPTIVVLTDRNDLDDQLYGQFSKCQEFLRQIPQQASSRENLKELLANREANGIIFTTMQKFEESGSALSQRRNIVVMADEAHRGQYGFEIKAIRAIDPETPIVVEPDGMGGDELLRFLPIFPYPNIFYSIHMYYPGDYTHQLDRDKPQYLSYPTEKWNKASIKERLLDRVVRYQKATNAKIFVGEFSCPRWAPGAEIYLRDVIELMEEFGWSWTYHAFRESDMWSVEHNTDPHDKQAYPGIMNPRKQVLLDALQKNKQ